MEGNADGAGLAYSIDGEQFTDDLEELLTDYIAEFVEPGEPRPQKVPVKMGQVRRFKASEFAGGCAERLLDELRDNAGDNAGEFAESWLEEVAPEQERDLEERLKQALDEWAEAQGHQPRFYLVEKVKDA